MVAGNSKHLGSHGCWTVAVITIFKVGAKWFGSVYDLKQKWRFDYSWYIFLMVGKNKLQKLTN
jgi:hypothetical protein